MGVAAYNDNYKFIGQEEIYEFELNKIKESVISRYDLTSIDENFAKICMKNLKNLQKILKSIKNQDDIVIGHSRKETKHHEN